MSNSIYHVAVTRDLRVWSETVQVDVAADSPEAAVLAASRMPDGRIGLSENHQGKAKYAYSVLGREAGHDPD